MVLKCGKCLTFRLRCKERMLIVLTRIIFHKGDAVMPSICDWQCSGCKMFMTVIKSFVVCFFLIWKDLCTQNSHFCCWLYRPPPYRDMLTISEPNAWNISQWRQTTVRCLYLRLNHHETSLTASVSLCKVSPCNIKKNRASPRPENPMGTHRKVWREIKGDVMLFFPLLFHYNVCYASLWSQMGEVEVEIKHAWVACSPGK